MDNPAPDPTVERMRTLVAQWSGAIKSERGFPRQPEDHRVIFLHCYLLMTVNMLAAIQRQEFHDPGWVDRLLHIFAGYYFTALDAFDQDPAAASPVWQLAFEEARHPQALAMQHLLLGVNAHINYDLIMALVDILQPEWASLTDDQRLLRYHDHCQVNHVISRTVDAVEEDVIDPEMPVMRLVDKIVGRHIEDAAVSDLLGHWREIVWRHATRLLDTPEAAEREKIVKNLEKEVLEIGEVIQMRGFKPEG